MDGLARVGGLQLSDRLSPSALSPSGVLVRAAQKQALSPVDVDRFNAFMPGFANARRQVMAPESVGGHGVAAGGLLADEENAHAVTR